MLIFENNNNKFETQENSVKISDVLQNLKLDNKYRC